MADNVPITAGVGTDIRTDEIGGKHLQIIKIALGADGVEDNLVDAGQQAMAASVPVVIASDQSPVDVDVPTATPTAYNLTLTNADTEYHQDLSANCRSFEFQCRTDTTIRFAFVTDKVHDSTAPFLTLKAGNYYSSPRLHIAGASILYFASATAGAIVEIIEWV